MAKYLKSNWRLQIHRVDLCSPRMPQIEFGGREPPTTNDAWQCARQGPAPDMSNARLLDTYNNITITHTLEASEAAKRRCTICANRPDRSSSFHAWLPGALHNYANHTKPSQDVFPYRIGPSPLRHTCLPLQAAHK